MTLLDRYLAKTVLVYTALVLAVLLSLGALFVFLRQQGDIGHGTYSTLDAFWFTLCQLPGQAFELLPMAALVGTLLGLGALQRDGELVVMRATGMSVWRVAAAVAGGGVLLSVVMLVLAQWVAPSLDLLSRQSKTFARFADVELGTLTGTGGAWVRDGRHVMSIGQQNADGRFSALTVFEFDEQRRLVAMATAASARADTPGTWVLDGWRETRVTARGVNTAGPREQTLQTGLSPDFLGLAVVNPSSLSLSGLWRYVEYQRRNGLSAVPFEIAFWSRVARLVSVVLVCMLAVPFTSALARSGGGGRQTVTGILLGVALFLFTRTLENSGQVYGLNPMLIGWGPAVLLAAVTVTLLARAR
jgi:lipopolysaccharide export system permease protein